MSRYTPTTVTSGYNTTDKINQNFADIQAAIDDTLSRVGDTPNQLETDVDANSHRFYNLPSPNSPTEPLRLADISLLSFADASVPAVSPSTAGKVLSNDGVDLSWADGVKVVSLISSLKAVSVSSIVDKAIYMTRGRNVEGVGSGVYRYNSASSASEDGILVIQPNTGSGRWELIHNGEISILQAGADPTKVSSSSSAVQAAMNAAATNKLTLIGNGGNYLIDTALSIPSNLKFVCHQGCVFYTNSTGVSVALGASGSLGAEKTFTADYDKGETSFTSSSAHGLVVGDWIRVIGQRNAISSDAGEDDRLGFGTPGSGCCYFGEFLSVKTTPTTTTFTTDGGLHFNNYRNDSSLETDPNARAATTFQKVTWVEDVVIDGLSVVTEDDQNGVFRYTYGKNIQIRNCSVNHGDFIGAAVFWADCLDCVAFNVTSEHGYDLDLVTNKANYNPFKTAGAQRCGFRSCQAIRPSQGVDFSYLNLGVCSLECYAIDCIVSDTQVSGMTSHGGTYAIQFLNNKLLNVNQGISCRSRNSIISGNIATYRVARNPVDALDYGFGLYEGWARDCVMSGNNAEGFYAGYSVVDGGSGNAGEQFGYVGAVITGNVATGCKEGYRYNAAASCTKTDLRQIVLSNNVFRNCVNKFVYLEGPAPGHQIINNTFTTLTAGDRGIFVGADSHPHTLIRGNTISNVGASANCIEVDSKTLTFPYSTDYTCIIDQNIFFGTYLATVDSSGTNLNHASLVCQSQNRIGAFAIPDGVTAPSTVSGFAFTYVDAADGDYKIKFGDGTIKTIVVDT